MTQLNVLISVDMATLASCVCFSLQYLTCLTTSRSQTDKLAFDVGLQENAAGMDALESCTLTLDVWW